MGFGGISFGSLLVIFVIVVLIFGTKRLRTIGEDLGAAIKSFRQGMQEEDSSTKNSEANVSQNTESAENKTKANNP